MISGVFLAWSSFYGGTIGNMLAQWEQWGVFSYVLPFLIIFALVFTIISNIKVFGGNKGVSVVISLAVALMALQVEKVPVFFSTVFPNVGIGLAAILVILIMIGLFTDLSGKEVKIPLIIIGAIVALAVLYNTAGDVGWYSGFLWQESLSWIPLVLGVAGLVLWVILGFGNKDKTPKYARVD